MIDEAFYIGLWVSAAVGVGFALFVTIAALAAGYILASFILGRAGRTVMGTHIRHFFSRIAPAKRFDPTDREIIERVVRDSISRGRINLKDLQQ